jgi:hypothetical protein
LDADGVVQAVLRLAAWPGVGRNRIGILGLSAGGALACLAAADRRLQGRLAFITLFGGYFDVTPLLRAVGRRALHVDGKLVPWQPNDILHQRARRCRGAHAPHRRCRDHRREPGIRRVGVRCQRQSRQPIRPQPAARAPGSAATYHLLAGDAPDQVEATIAALPPAQQELLRTLSPSTVVDRIATTVYLLHDTSDQFLPFTESRGFDVAPTRLHRPHQFVEFSIFAYVEVRSGVGIAPLVGDGAPLFAVL